MLKITGQKRDGEWIELYEEHHNVLTESKATKIEGIITSLQQINVISHRAAKIDPRELYILLQELSQVFICGSKLQAVWTADPFGLKSCCFINEK